MMQSKVIGITGGSGTGKSYISDILRKEGIPVFDADKIGHDIYDESSECRRELVECFGDKILSDGGIDRKKLGNIVFSEPELLKKLNEITHKYILERIYNKVEACNEQIICADGALLIESGMKCDAMIGVTASYDVRLRRIMNRDGISESAARKRLDAQKKDDFYINNCDFIIENNGGNLNIDSINEFIKGICNEKTC